MFKPRHCAVQEPVPIRSHLTQDLEKKCATLEIWNQLEEASNVTSQTVKHKKS